jgi:threonine synthase
VDIFVSGNFERLTKLVNVVSDFRSRSVHERRRNAGQRINDWLHELNTASGFSVSDTVAQGAKKEFESERISDEQTLETIGTVYAFVVPQESGAWQRAQLEDRRLHPRPTLRRESSGPFLPSISHSAARTAMTLTKRCLLSSSPWSRKRAASGLLVRALAAKECGTS